MDLGAALASLAESMLPTLAVAVLAAGTGAGAALWFAARRWMPAVQRLTATVERELGRVERLAARSMRPAPGAAPPLASVRGALDGVQALRAIMDDLDHHSASLKHLAHRIAETSEPGAGANGLVRQATHSAEHLARTLERTRQTYRLLSASLGQLAQESDDLQAREVAVHEQARVLTGALHEVRDMARPPRPARDRRPADAARDVPARDRRPPDGERDIATRDRRPPDGERAPRSVEYPVPEPDRERRIAARERDDRVNWRDERRSPRRDDSPGDHSHSLSPEDWDRAEERRARQPWRPTRRPAPDDDPPEWDRPPRRRSI